MFKLTGSIVVLLSATLFGIKKYYLLFGDGDSDDAVKPQKKAKLD